MKGETSVLISAVLMGTLPYFVKSLQLSPLTTTFYRLSVGLVFLSIFMLIFRQKPRVGRDLLILGVANTSVIFLYITAITHLSAATAALLLYMAPVYVLIYAILTGDVRIRSVFSLLIGILGLYLLLSPEKEINVGILAGLASGVIYAVVFIMLNRLGKKYTPVQITFSNLLIGTLILLPFFRYENANLLHILGLGLIPTAIPFILLSYGMGRVKVEKGPIIALSEPVTAGIVGYVAFNEILTGIQMIGAVMILVSVVLSFD
uniref:Permease n=1 Tax=Geoglobus ahangari TaxID=113653 RepID=A0A7C3UBV9_9EURY